MRTGNHLQLIAPAMTAATALAAESAIKEYPVPKGSHPHDYAPATEQFTVYPLPSPAPACARSSAVPAMCGYRRQGRIRWR